MNINKNLATIPAGAVLTDTIPAGMKLDESSVSLNKASVDNAGNIADTGVKESGYTSEYVSNQNGTSTMKVTLPIRVNNTQVLAAGEISHPQTNQNDQLGTG